MEYDTPVLLLIFNRADAVRRLVDSLRAVRPSKLYVGADGPRANKRGEAAACERARRELEAIDWPCEIKTLFQEENLGCRAAVHGAISWFFEQEEQGIILEDDCLPDPSFFRFAGELLTHYADDERVMHIAGDNPLRKITQSRQESYSFVRMPLVWGWATWRRAWQKMNLHLEGLDAYDFKGTPYGSLVKNYLREKFEATRAGENDSWAYAWYFTILQQNGICILPKDNLVQNTGFGANSTHTQSPNKARELQAGKMDFPLRHPAVAEPEDRLDMLLFFVAQKSLPRLLLRSILPKWLRKS